MQADKATPDSFSIFDASSVSDARQQLKANLDKAVNTVPPPLLMTINYEHLDGVYFWFRPYALPSTCSLRLPHIGVAHIFCWVQVSSLECGSTGSIEVGR